MNSLPFLSIRQSMLNLFCNCQVAFAHRYLDGEIIPPAIAARIGTGVHKAAEINHKQKIDSGMDMPISDMQDVAVTEYKRLVDDEGVYFVGSTQELHNELGKGEDLTVKLAESYGRNLAPQINPIEAELYVEAQHPDLPIPFAGTIDLVDAFHGIVDLKTASKKWRSGKEKETAQPDLYKFLYAENRGIEPDFGFYVLAYTGDANWVPVPKGLHMERIIGIAKAMISACESGDFMPAVPGHWMCSKKWCGWHGSCKYAQK